VYVQRVLVVIVLSLAASAAQAAVEGCRDCHASLPGTLGEPAAKMGAKDVHAAAGLGCIACHGGVAASPTKDVAHGAGWTGKPASSADAAAICGRCHAAEQQNYLRGPHHVEKPGRKNPECFTCHGAHGIERASVELIGEPLCSSCHTFPQANRIRKALIEAETDIAALDRQLPKDAKGRPKLMEARGNLRGLAHALDLMAITRNAAQALAVVDEVRASDVPQVKASLWGKSLRIAGLVVLGFFALVALVVGVRFVYARRHHLPVVGKFGGREWKIAGAALGVLAAIGGIAAFRGNQYVEHEPKFCLSCHTMNSAYDLWEQSGHKDIDCHKCHTPNVVDNLKQLYVYTTERPDKVVRHAFVEREVCQKCHGEGATGSKLNQVMITPGHRLHAGKQRIECVQCHSTSLHKFKPPKETCAQCHKQITLAAAGTMAEMHCLQCHPFMAADAKRSLKPDRAACLDCHANRQVATEVFPSAKAPMKWDCGKCHKPHEKLNIGNADCIKCHDAINEGLHQVKAHVQDCQGCHKPHTWSSGVATCTTCHTRISPARHHPGKGACTECHGAWNDNWVKLAQVSRK
jgi:hypothetical protein